MFREVKIDLQYQKYIPGPPVPKEELMAQAVSRDKVTVDFWRKAWIGQTKENHEKHGPFAANSAAKYFNKYANKPAIIVGSGPSLKHNISVLKKNTSIPVLSCLHNFHYLEDNDVKVDHYVSLDAGPVTLEEISEGGQNPPDYYIQRSSERDLMLFVGSHPNLTDSWKGTKSWFSCPLPDEALVEEMEKVEKVTPWVSSGGNVLGACFYLAKALMGCNPIIFVGADFCFSYDNKFHPWDSKYDANLGQYVFATDVFGNTVKTWGSYWNFKCWFDNRAVSVPGIYINASEGGIFGAYKEGNIQQVQQWPLEEVLKMYGLNEPLRAQCENPSDSSRVTLF